MAGAVLIIDHVAARREALADRLRRRYHQVIEAETSEAALAILQDRRPALVLLSADAPKPLGLELCPELKAAAPSTPVLLYSDGEECSARRAALMAGADDFLALPRDDDAFWGRVRSLMRMKSLSEELELRRGTARELGLAPEDGDDNQRDDPSEIMLVAPKGPAADRLATTLSTAMNARCFIAESGFAAMRRMERAPADAVVVADAATLVSLDEGFAERENPVDLITAITGIEAARHTPILYLTKDDHPQTRNRKVAAALDAGASDCAYSDLAWEELILRLSAHLARKRYADRLRNVVDEGLRNAVRDPLTHLHNRRYLETHFARSFERARETGTPLSVLMFDVDHFKSINDEWGHAAGDEALIDLARALQREVRVGDLIARYGGDEFVIVMPGANAAQAAAAAERIRQRLSREEDEGIPFTVSVGVAAATIHDQGPDDLLRRADAMLIAAKVAGRDQVVIA